VKPAILVLALALALSAIPAAATTRACTTAMVTGGICPSTSYVAYTLAISTTDPDGAGPLQAPSALILDAFALVYNYSSPTVCTADLVAAGVCAAGSLGQAVAITKAQFVDSQVRAYVLNTIRRYNVLSAVQAAEATAKTQADPDLGN